MYQAMELVLNTFESMERASGKAIDTASIRAAREELARAGASMEMMEQNIQQAAQAQEKLNQQLKEGASGAKVW